MKTLPTRALSLMSCALLAAHVAHAADAPATSKPANRPAASSLLQLDDGRSGKGNLIATTGIRGFSKPQTVAAHALIMTIGDYQGNIPKLKGVPFDIATATDIARRLGVPASNIQTLKDEQLTLDGMRKAFDDLEAKLGGDDQVFIYYSGHGGRQLVQEADGERCAESLISVDGRAFLDAEIEARLKRISAKTQKTIVFLDACHSGGVTTRALGNANAPFSAKAYNAGPSCVRPTNMVTRSLAAPKPPGSGGANFVHIAAARDSEVSLDQPGRGGVASQAWLACLAGAARDTDGSGGLSAGEIQACAQDRIDDKLKNVQGFLPHHVSVTGNTAMVLSYAARDPGVAGATATDAPTPAPLPAAEVSPPAAAPSPVPAAPAAPLAAPVITPVVPVATAVAAATSAAVAAGSKPPTSSSTPAAATPTPAPAATPAPVAKPSPIAALQDIYNSRDDRRLVTLTAPKTKLKIGVDNIDFTVTSREGGYVYLLMVGSDGQTFDLLFPNQIDRNNQIEPGASMRLPRPSWALTVEGPPGRDTLLAIVTDSPRDFAAAGMSPAGPFSIVPAVATKDIQLVTSGPASANEDQCAASASTRTLAIRKRCSTAYGAALLNLDEVR
jgi:Caspase domain/Domain of unknown function (DUF4384)